MGVKGLLGKFFRTRAAGASKSQAEKHKQGYIGSVKDSLDLENLDVATLDFDFNFLLYAIARYAYGLDEFSEVKSYREYLSRMTILERDKRCYEIVETIIMAAIKFYRPYHSVSINIDGVPPMAKISQQRTRRYVTGLSLSDQLFDTNSISPGTLWMHSLHLFLKKSIKRIYNAMLLENMAPVLIYSSYLVPGEGEHKIFEKMRSREHIYKNMGGIKVILGGDTDLILLSMISGIDNIYVVTDMNFSIPDEHGNYINIRSNPKMNPSVIDIDALKRGIRTELNKRESAIDDFVFVISLVGNDFIPRLPSMNDLSEGIESIMNSLRLTTIVIVDPNTKSINWPNVLQLMNLIITGNEDKNITSDIYRISSYSKSIGKNRAPWRPYDAAIEATIDKYNIDEFRNNFRSAWYYNALVPKSYIIEDFLASGKTIIDMCIQYLFGLNWISKYYNFGSEYVTWTWEYKYHYAPMLCDIARVLRILIEKGNISILNPSAPEGEVRLTPLHQLLPIIPPVSKNILPVPIRSLWEDNSLISDLLVVGFIIDQDGYTPHSRNISYEGKYEKIHGGEDSWQGTVIISSFPYFRIISAINSLNLPTIVLKQYSFKTEKMLGSYSAAPTNPVKIINTERLNWAPKSKSYERANDQKTRKYYNKVPTGPPIDTEKARHKYFIEHSREPGRGRGRGRGRENISRDLGNVQRETNDEKRKKEFTQSFM